MACLSTLSVRYYNKGAIYIPITLPLLRRRIGRGAYFPAIGCSYTTDSVMDGRCDAWSTVTFSAAWTSHILICDIQTGGIPVVIGLNVTVNCNLACGREPLVCTLMPNFTTGFKNVGLQPPKSPKIGIFWYKFAQKGYTPLSEFLQNLSWWRESQVRTLIPNFTVLTLKCGHSRKNREQSQFFGINLPLLKKFGGPQKKLSIGAQLQTFLHVMTP